MRTNKKYQHLLHNKISDNLHKKKIELEIKYNNNKIL